MAPPINPPCAVLGRCRVYIPDASQQQAPLPSDKYNYWSVQEKNSTPPRQGFGLLGSQPGSQPATPSHLEPYAGMVLSQPSPQPSPSPVAAPQQQQQELMMQQQQQQRQRGQVGKVLCLVLASRSLFVGLVCFSTCHQFLGWQPLKQQQCC